MTKDRTIIIILTIILLDLVIPSVGETASSSAVISVVDQLLQSHRLKEAHVGIAVRSLREETSILNYNAQKYFCPASNEKLLLTLAALKDLGPDYRFKTEIYVKNGAVIRDGILYSDVLIKGYGDPTLDANAIGEVFTHVPEFKGINKVAGSLLLDLSYFDDTFWGPGWCWDDDNYYIAAIAFKTTRFLLTSPRDPIAYLQVIGQQIREGFSDRGITFTGGVKAARLSTGWELVAEITSQPLQMLLQSMDYFSDNFIADQVLKSLGAHRYGQGTFQNGAQAMEESLKGIIHSPIQIADGSGLSRYNLLMPLQLVELLSYAFAHPTLGLNDQGLDFVELRNASSNGQNLFIQALPPWGGGTLSTRGYELNAYAKTGTLTNISALSGYLMTGTGDVLVFSILINDVPSVADARGFQDDLLVVLKERSR